MNVEANERDRLGLIVDALESLRTDMLAESAQRLDVHHRRPYDAVGRSVANLTHYLALRQHDLCALQDHLARHGLSSLGGSEAHVLHTLDAVRGALLRMRASAVSAHDGEVPGITPFEAADLLAARTARVFGAPPGQRHPHPRIMVTLPIRAAQDSNFCRQLIAAGMDCARIDCARDNPAVWERMLGNLRRAAGEAGRRCTILMELAGRKPRTGPIAPAASVAHLKPLRDALGRPVGPAEVWLHSPGAPFSDPAPRCRFELPTALAECLQVGDRLGFDDTRGKSRELVIVDHPAPERWLAHSFQSAWLTPETPVRLLRRSHKGALRPQSGEYRLGGFRVREECICLKVGDQFLLACGDALGETARYDANGRRLRPARIGCVECSSLAPVEVGDPVWIDHGQIGAQVLERRADGLLLRVTQARPGGVALKSGRSLAFARSEPGVPTLTEKDLADLDFIVRHADAVGLSGVESPANLECLFEQLRARDAERLAVIAKIDNARAVLALPELLRTGLGPHPFALMIAGGDLAVALGVGCMAELQGQIFGLAKAAHTPVVWSTQGCASLADAMLGQSAECVMMDREGQVLDTLHALNEALCHRRSRRHRNAPRPRGRSTGVGLD